MLTKKIFNIISKCNSKCSLLKIGRIQSNLLFKINKNLFTEKENDSHSDFKPKSKVTLTNDNVFNQIDEWVKGNDVLLFMKGVPQMPQCGFSNYVCQILKFYNVKKFKSVNILEDQILRESVKQYSNWPTYPQLYVKGNLIGK